ncbi:LuxR C-terminal-related transcriptional regulator [Micromonospora soli]|uniref:helix-turn-helix transcriptional regulator n=1 Tax=Micromonospora sp. NBRC 110009 TaxID=3061627 RepID=UPI002673B8C9|nr:LuxR family transcriptional regulator [Micromonospora sp. NBRC 110009]WKT96861.1 LuxR C-terminal-related transcriptional regulator [Micromonospora sp. NBRC 110009]
MGRSRECLILDAALHTSPRHGVALMVWGDPGVGKTTLLDHVARSGRAPMIRARGVESEAVLPFATLADLLIPLRAHFADLPLIQRDALEGALALSDADAPNPYAVCAAALNVLSAAADRAPMVVLVDDLHWVDHSSQRALLFVARRIGPERIALIMTGRDDAELRRRCDLPALSLAGLTRADCDLLLRSRGIVAVPSVLDGLVERTAGNPLALLEWASSLRADQLAGHRPIGEALPTGRQLELAWLPDIDRLPKRTRAALAVVGVSRSSAVELLEPALAFRGLGVADLAPAEAARIVVTDGAHYEFRHPLLRSAVLGRTPLAERRAACHALADVTSGATRAWYRASAAAGPDAAVTAELIEAAKEARRRSGYDGAALAWYRAAQLTPHPDERAELLRNAATDSFLAGGAARAAGWCEEALQAAADPLLRADLELLRGRIHTWIGHTGVAYDRMVAAAEAVREVDPARACSLLNEATLPGAMDGRIEAIVRRGEEAVTLAATAGISVDRSVVLRGLAYIVDGRIREGLDGLRSSAAFLEAADPIAEQQLLTLVAQSLTFGEQFAEGFATVRRVIRAARQHTAPAILPIALAVRSETEYWVGRWAEAQADAAEALRWAEEMGHTSAVGFALACLARLDAQRGDRERCAERISTARRETGPYRIGTLDMYFSHAIGAAALAQADYAEAITQLEEAFQHTLRIGMTNPRVIPFVADLIEAHVRAGRPERAREPLTWLQLAAERTGLIWPRAILARCRGLLAGTAARAEQCFAEAEREHRRQDHPFELARTQMCRGEALRRFRRPAAGRVPLTAAHACFESLGAGPWARRAAAELAATGQRMLPNVMPAALDLLSPQEVQVARAIAGGLNNAEAASLLFVSRKTVEAHLTRVYRKLGVRSRTDLTRALVSAGLVR